METKSRGYTTGGERLSAGFYVFGAILSYYMIMSYLQLFMTDIGIPAISVGLIFIVAKVWDAVNDPIFGVAVDKFSFKGGKYKPWLRIASIAIPVTTILLFIVPANISIQAKIIWSSVAYVLWDTAYTMYDVPLHSLYMAMTEDLNERNRLFSISSFSVYLGALAISIVVPMLFPNIGWSATGIIIGALCFAFMQMLNFKCKERFVGASKKESSIKEIIMSLVRNKYLLIFTLATIIGGITNLSMSMNSYFAIHCLGGRQWITPLALASAIPVLLVVLLVPKILGKIDKFTATMLSRGAMLLIDLTIFFLGYKNTTLFLAMIVVKNMFGAVWNITSIAFIADCVEYAQFRTGERNQGIAFATKAFNNKLIVALTGSIAMFGLAAFGFTEGAGAAQSQSTIDGIWFLYSFFPIIGNTVCLCILALFFKLRDKDIRIMVRCNNGEITREEAEASLARKY
ncbi:MAG: glycoside-pentoside-hexuronide (GPH):cation symporter [Clostridiales bacterium]|jgi:sugar (glycoside-pentoside-hexuronide) transporter|nr:glycoside-pentoside-hexuronide (GPH):cation symporter [Clostridiales bacterium]